MKALVVLFCIASTATAQMVTFQPARVPTPPTPHEMMLQRMAESTIAFKPSDPWRNINGQVVPVKGPYWVQFVGKVVEVQPKGIRVEGYYGWPFIWPDNVTSQTLLCSNDEYKNGQGILPIPDVQEFFVKDFPYEPADGDYILWENKRMALLGSGSPHTYTTVMGGSRTLRQLDYGTVAAPPAPRPATPEEIEAQRKQKIENQAKTLAWQKQLSDNGDPYGMFRMGQRYLRGDEVDKDEQKGRELIAKAANAGNLEAQALRDKLSTNTAAH